MGNDQLLKKFLEEDTIALNEDELLWQSPRTLPETTAFDRIDGMLLGLAIGDALGNTSESINPDDRGLRFGEITGYLPNRYADDRKVGLPSDDTQMAFWAVEVLLTDGHLIPDHMASRFSCEQIFGMGSSVRQFMRNYKDQQLPWHQAGAASAGNGALMRIAPVVLPHLRHPSCELWADAAFLGMVTHNDRASTAACVAFTAILWEVFCMDHAPEPTWWLEKYCQIAAPLEGSGTRYPSRRTNLHYNGPIWKFTLEQVQRAWDENWTSLQASNTWGSGAYLLETIPNVLLILMNYAHDPEQAIIRAVNDTRDNDTVAAIVGAAIGALHGKSFLPERWIKGLLGRTNASNDGHVFGLIQQVKQKFWGLQ